MYLNESTLSRLDSSCRMSYPYSPVLLRRSNAFRAAQPAPALRLLLFVFYRISLYYLFVLSRSFLGKTRSGRPAWCFEAMIFGKLDSKLLSACILL